MTIKKRIGPQKGPQELAFGCPADILIYGGSAGCGKSFYLTFSAMKHINTPKYNAIIFRRVSPAIRGGGGIWDESLQWYPKRGGVPRGNSSEWRFPSGARIEFSHLQYESDRLTHQSKQYCFIGFDQLEEFTKLQFWFLLSRARSTCGITPRVRGSCNPDPDSFVADLISWWISPEGQPIPERNGVIRWFVRNQDTDELIWADKKEDLLGGIFQPMSFSFIAGLLEDNPILLEKDSTYKTRLQALPMIERERLLKGNWKIKATAGNFFKEGFFEFVDAAPVEAKRARAWDKAGTEGAGAYTVGVKVAKTKEGLYFVEDIKRFQGSPHRVEQEMKATAELDGVETEIAIWQDPGQAGKSDIDHLIKLLSGFSTHGIPATKSKEVYASPVSAQAEAGNYKLVRGEWNKDFVNEMVNFPDSKFKDQVDATSLAHLFLNQIKKEIYFA